MASDYGAPSPAPPRTPGTGLDNADLPCAFWDAVPAGTDHPDLLAIEALKEESTPEERAETLKAQANDALRRGAQLRKKFYVKEGLGLYNEALALPFSDDALRAVLLSNRAQAHLLLENNRSALDDAVASSALAPADPKAHFRAARAALRLTRWDAAAAAAAAGLTLCPGDAEFVKLAAAAESGRAAAKEAAAAEAANALAARAPARRLASALLAKGYKVGYPQVSVGARRPHLDSSGAAHWPLVFVYPEAGGASDAVEDACESDTLGAHLDAMFGPGAPPLQWDSENAYGRDRLEVYYLSHATQPLALGPLTEVLYGGWPEGVAPSAPQRYGPRAARWVRAAECDTLHAILTAPDCVIPGVPVLFVLAVGTAFRQRFLKAGE